MIKTNLRLYSEAPARAARQFVDMIAKTGMPGSWRRGGEEGRGWLLFNPLNYPVRVGGKKWSLVLILALFILVPLTLQSSLMVQRKPERPFTSGHWGLEDGGFNFTALVPSSVCS